MDIHNHASKWYRKILFGFLFWISFFQSIIIRKSIAQAIMSKEEPRLNPKYWNENIVYNHLKNSFISYKELDLSAAIYIQYMVFMNPLGSINIAAEYMKTNLSHNLLVKAALRKILYDKYRYFLIKARAEGIDEGPVLDAIEKIKKT